MLVVTYLGLFRYLFRPRELRSAELVWDGPLDVGMVRGATGDAQARGQMPAGATAVAVAPVATLPPPITDKPIPPPPAPPKPSAIVVVRGVPQDKPILTVLLKRTYSFAPGAPAQAVSPEKQQPLSLTNAFSVPLVKGAPSSVSQVVEAIAYKSGTDVVIRGVAKAPEPVTQMNVSVAVGGLKHQAIVYGNRKLDYVNGRVMFTPPERFTAMPLGYELAYGGSDPAFDAEALTGVFSMLSEEQARRIRALFQDTYDKGVPPFVYPRNRVGKGYVIVKDPKRSVGRELPNVELAADKLTPERIILKDVRDWPRMPVPAGFDFLDLFTFPRTAMSGLPPIYSGSLQEVMEVSMNQVPRDYYRGNIFETPREKIPDLIHPDVGRCAAMGLRCGFLKGDEVVTLSGMDAKVPEMQVKLPGERPVFSLSVRDKKHSPEAQLFQVFVDVEQHLLTTVWAGSIPLDVALNYGEEKKIQETVQWQMQSADAPVAHGGRGGLLGWLGLKG